jgi:CheY-like chemotaxis protein
MKGQQRRPKTEWRVLLVDDDDDYSLIIEGALRAAAGVPVEIRRARTGEEALDLLRDSVPDLLLLDLKMPGMGGHGALEEIKRDDALRSVAVVVLSSSDRGEDVAKSYGLGGNHFITKPSSPLELEAKFAGLLRNLTELGEIRRGSSGSSTTAVSAVDPHSMARLKGLRWVAVVGVLIALYLFGKISGAF